MLWESEVVLRDVSNAGLLVSDRIGRDAVAQLDLEDALEASRYSSHPYSSPPKEWPPAVEVTVHGSCLQYLLKDTMQLVVYISIGHSLVNHEIGILERDGQCPEYSGEEQAICAVGLAKSKAGIFVEAIQYLLVLATPTELILVGVCCTGRRDGTDPYAEVSLQPLPEYTIPSDGVTMTCISSTNKGHIFLAGRDGHAYEMQYKTGSGWQRRCRKVCLTAGLGSLVSRWVVPNVFKFASVDPIVEMIVDNERYILYARTEDMKLQVFDLGANGNGPLKKVAEEKNLVNQRDSQLGGRQSAGSRTATRASKPSIVCITPLSTVESKWLHFVAVLSDGTHARNSSYCAIIVFRFGVMGV
ncbi:hypothetical protein IFM89_007417 [Coptis chinensis]|uniref:Nucleoporin Nup133/Nup155-like N-terminal domain-containing protein n=1 Tax=Coptis chinensis TaxID=261450 RepID=A0A835IUM6_9MAGN|nr:hypothetical protein IFM89_007417 [Coptis chinensis]